MKRIIDFLNRIPRDRWQHYTLGMEAAGWGLLLVAAVAGVRWGFLCSLAVVVCAAVVKERWNKSCGGNFDRIDLVVTLAGGLTVWMWFGLYTLLV